MKRKFGVLAILLPIPNPKNPLVLPYPIDEGDRLQTAMMQQLLQAAPATLPLSHLARHKLILNLFFARSGTHIAVFPSLEDCLNLPGGRVHPLLLTACPPDRLDVFLGSDQHSIDLQLPVLAAEKHFKTLLANVEKPHLLSIAPDGQVAAITEGYYIDRQNIRRALGMRKPKKINLVKPY